MKTLGLNELENIHTNICHLKLHKFKFIVFSEKNEKQNYMYKYIVYATSTF